MRRERDLDLDERGVSAVESPPASGSAQSGCQPVSPRTGRESGGTCQLTPECRFPPHDPSSHPCGIPAYRLWYSPGEKPPLICRECGSLVIDREEHDAWHTALQSAFVMLDRRHSPESVGATDD